MIDIAVARGRVIRGLPYTVQSITSHTTDNLYRPFVGSSIPQVMKLNIASKLQLAFVGASYRLTELIQTPRPGLKNSLTSTMRRDSASRTRVQIPLISNG